MPYQFKYMPTFRGRQQELLVFKSFDFEQSMFPMLEIVKEKDRINNRALPKEIWRDYILSCKAQQVLVDLPVYIKDSPSMSDEVVSFNRTTLSNIERRIEFYNSLAPCAHKMIPVVSTLFYKTREEKTITRQIAELRKTFPKIAVRTFTGSLESDLDEIQNLMTAEDILIYDIDTVQPLNPFVRKQTLLIDKFQVPYKVVLRSAINTEIQNTKLEHGEVVAEADNSLISVYLKPLKMNAFGDYAGIKKDELSGGGTISPGFLLYDPIDNLFYGYKGEKSLDEFGNKIVPDILASNVVKQIMDTNPDYLDNGNWGFNEIREIERNPDSGRSQAKFKRIAMEHYLYCIKIMINKGLI